MHQPGYLLIAFPEYCLGPLNILVLVKYKLKLSLMIKLEQQRNKLLFKMFYHHIQLLRHSWIHLTQLLKFASEYLFVVMYKYQFQTLGSTNYKIDWKDIWGRNSYYYVVSGSIFQWGVFLRAIISDISSGKAFKSTIKMSYVR